MSLETLDAHLAHLQPLHVHQLSQLGVGAVLGNKEGVRRDGTERGGRERVAREVESVLGQRVGDGESVSYVMPRLYGLLGNVLFQTAAALVLAWQLDAIRLHGRRWRVVLPAPRDHTQCGKTFLASSFSSPLITRRNLAQLAAEVEDWYYLDEGACHICHTDIVAGARLAPPGASIQVRGWRQSYKYFEAAADAALPGVDAHTRSDTATETQRQRLVDSISLPPHLEAAALVRFRQLTAGYEAETVSVHIRRGDLLAEKGTVLSLSYYERAIEHMGKDKLFLVFSDDIEWCKQTPLFRHLPHVVFVQVGIDFLELRLMSMCDHHSIANSTFSWWGAYLHNPPRKRRRRRTRPRDQAEEGTAGVGATRGTGAASSVKESKSSVKESKSVVICPATWGRGDDPVAGRELGEGEIYPRGWVRVPNHFVG
jgi:hypothetical protein